MSSKKSQEVVKFVLRPRHYPVKFVFWLGEFNQAGLEQFARSKSVLHKEDSLRGWDEGDLGLCWPLGTNAVIWLKETNIHPRSVDSIMHECTHAVLRTGRELGFTPSEDAEEYFAYMQGWLAGELFKKLLK